MLCYCEQPPTAFRKSIKSKRIFKKGDNERLQHHCAPLYLNWKCNLFQSLLLHHQIWAVLVLHIY